MGRNFRRSGLLHHARGENSAAATEVGTEQRIPLSARLDADGAVGAAIMAAARRLPVQELGVWGEPIPLVPRSQFSSDQVR